MYITITVQTDVAFLLHKRQSITTASEELLHTAKELGEVLQPVHIGTKDSNLVSYFRVEVPDSATAERVIARLRHCKAIEAAYLKPSDEMP